MRVMISALLFLAVLSLATPVGAQSIREEVIRYIVDPCNLAKIREIESSLDRNHEEASVIRARQNVSSEYIKALILIVQSQGENFLGRMKLYTVGLQACLERVGAPDASEEEKAKAWKQILKGVNKKNQGRQALKERREGFARLQKLEETREDWEPGKPRAKDYDNPDQWAEAYIAWLYKKAWEERQEKKAPKVLDVNPPRFTDPPACLDRGDCFDRGR